MDGNGRMKVIVWMMMMMALMNKPPAVSPTSLSHHHHPEDADFKLPKIPKIPHIPVPPKVLIVGLCIYECHAICQDGQPSILYRACMLHCLPKKCRPSRLDVVDDCALACMAATITSANDKVEGYIETCYKNCGKNY